MSAWLRRVSSVSLGGSRSRRGHTLPDYRTKFSQSTYLHPTAVAGGPLLDALRGDWTLRARPRPSVDRAWRAARRALGLSSKARDSHTTLYRFLRRRIDERASTRAALNERPSGDCPSRATTRAGVGAATVAVGMQPDCLLFVQIVRTICTNKPSCSKLSFGS